MNTWFRQKKIKQEEQDILEKTNDVLDFLQLKHIANEYAGNLSGGQKKLLELGRTMMVKPQIVLLDEVGAGVNRTLLNTIGDAILRLNKDLNYTFCMIEHDIDFISRLCDPVIVMAEGSILMTDEISKVRKNEEVIEVYLGKN
jgi:branched-chain amino acid transport system ATP-binding protein